MSRMRYTTGCSRRSRVGVDGGVKRDQRRIMAVPRHDEFILSARLRTVHKIVSWLSYPPNGRIESFITDCARIIRTQSRRESFYTRSRIIAAARAFDLDAIDMAGLYSASRACSELSLVDLGLR